MTARHTDTYQSTFRRNSEQYGHFHTPCALLQVHPSLDEERLSLVPLPPAWLSTLLPFPSIPLPHHRYRACFQDPAHQLYALARLQTATDARPRQAAALQRCAAAVPAPAHTTAPLREPVCVMRCLCCPERSHSANCTAFRQPPGSQPTAPIPSPPPPARLAATSLLSLCFFCTLLPGFMLSGL